MTAEHLLEEWLSHARDGIFGSDFQSESCAETCNDVFKCVACLTEKYFEARKADMS